jgi:biotin carboxylase
MTKSRKQIMVLGAGPFQLPGIQKAVDLGYHVTTVDYLPDNIGHTVSHRYLNASTTDMEHILTAAQLFGVDGICTFSSDVAIPAVGYVCDKLNLPGVSYEAAQAMSSKHLFREFLRTSDLAHPAFVAGHQIEDITSGLDSLRFPVVVKPVDTSGSRGVTKIDSPDLNGVAEAFDLAHGFSRSGIVCVEEFVDGTEVGGDGYLNDGHFAFIAITHKHLNKFVVTGHSIPTNISPADQQQVVTTLETACAKLGYRDGPLNFDVMVSPERTVILEMSARNGGNGIPSVINHATGVDVEVLTLHGAVGDPVEPGHGTAESSIAPVIRGAGSYVFGSMREGILEGILDREELEKSVPGILDYYLAHSIGDEVSPFVHNGNLIGYALFECGGSEEYREITTLIDASLDIHVVEGK